MLFDYVVSGCSRTRFNNLDFKNNEEAQQAVGELFRKVDGANNHNISLLFNAFLEEGFGRVFREIGFADATHSIHSDSGGLQIVTQGREITEEIKKKIYKVQGEYSDVAMSFDEIPVIMSGSRSGRNDTKNRFFNRENLAVCAKNSGINLRNQLKFFVENDYATKPLLIVHGNCADSYKEWVDLVLKEVPDELIPKIGGFASGSAALGTGALEDVQRMFYASIIDLPDEIPNYMHILGVGSFRRLMPALIFHRGGLYGDMEISYDSTTHTTGIDMGFYYKDLKLTKTGTHVNKRYEKIVADIFLHFPELQRDPVFEEVLCACIFGGTKEFRAVEKKIGRDLLVERYQAIFAFILGSIYNFTKTVDSFYNSNRKEFFTYFKKEKEGLPYLHLSGVKTEADFKHWEREVGRRMVSQPVREQASAELSIENFF